MSNNEYETAAAPGGGSKIDWDVLNGALIIIKPLLFEANVQTQNGARDVVQADVIVVDGPQAGAEYESASVWPKVLVSQLKPKLGAKILGRVGQGNKKPGQNAPWILNDPTPDDIKAAKAHEAKQNPFDTATAAPPF